MLNPEGKKLDVSIHAILAHSYMAYFILFLLGILFHVVFLTKISNSSFIVFLGFLLLFLGTVLVFWAQHTSRKLDNNNITKDSFCRGPYCYVRMPTHLGLFSLMLGLSLLVNSFFIFLLAFVSFFLNKFYFIKKEETFLSNKYGTPYLEYKKAVRF